MIDVEIKTCNGRTVRIFINSFGAKVSVYENGKLVAWSYYPDPYNYGTHPIEELVKRYLLQDMSKIVETLSKVHEDLINIVEKIKQLHTMISLLT